MKILSKEEIITLGIEFAGDVCYSGVYGQQVYTKEMEEGGVPIDGILYEKYPSGSVIYYQYHKNGIPHGERVEFYESGKLLSYCVMDTGAIDGKHTIWYEDGKVKQERFCKYGLVLRMKKFDEMGNIISEKKELKDDEKEIYEKLNKEELTKNEDYIKC